jgi:hypothetical protein
VTTSQENDVEPGRADFEGFVSWLLPRLPQDERSELTRDFARDVFDAYTRRGMEAPSWLSEIMGEDGRERRGDSA